MTKFIKRYRGILIAITLILTLYSGFTAYNRRQIHNRIVYEYERLNISVIDEINDNIRYRILSKINAELDKDSQYVHRLQDRVELINKISEKKDIVVYLKAKDNSGINRVDMYNVDKFKVSNIVLEPAVSYADFEEYDRGLELDSARARYNRYWHTRSSYRLRLVSAILCTSLLGVLMLYKDE